MTVWRDYAADIKDKFNAKHCALLIVDVQHSFCAPDGITGSKHANTKMQELPTRINKFVDDFLRRGGLPIYIKSIPDQANASPKDKWLNELKQHKRPQNSTDSSLDFYGLDIAKDAIIIEKKSDGFADTRLKEILTQNHIETLMVCGVRTEICVRRVAERSASEGYLVFVIEDLCATRDANSDHADQALMFLNAYTGVVISSERMSKLL